MHPLLPWSFSPTCQSVCLFVCLLVGWLVVIVAKEWGILSAPRSRNSNCTTPLVDGLVDDAGTDIRLISSLLFLGSTYRLYFLYKSEQALAKAGETASREKKRLDKKGTYDSPSLSLSFSLARLSFSFFFQTSWLASRGRAIARTHLRL